jgi:hypothetical protein
VRYSRPWAIFVLLTLCFLCFADGRQVNVGTMDDVLAGMNCGEPSCAQFNGASRSDLRTTAANLPLASTRSYVQRSRTLSLSERSELKEGVRAVIELSTAASLPLASTHSYVQRSRTFSLSERSELKEGVRAVIELTTVCAVILSHMKVARRQDGRDDWYSTMNHGSTDGSRRGATLALPQICVPVSVNEGFVAVLVVRYAWTKASIVKSFADKFDKVPSSFKSCSFRFPLDLRVSSLPLPDTQQTDASSKNASRARSKHLCWYASGGVTPNVIECANTSYEGSLIGLPLQLCSETSLGRQRSLLFWPSSDHKGSSDVAITGTGTRPRELTLGCEPPLVPPLRGQSPQVGAASQRMRSPTPPARPPALRTGTEPREE